MAVFQTAGVPPSRGRIIFVNIGSMANSISEPRNSAAQ